MEKQEIYVNGELLCIPSYYQKVDSMPGDPENSVPYEVQTHNAGCIAFISTVDISKASDMYSELFVVKMIAARMLFVLISSARRYPALWLSGVMISRKNTSKLFSLSRPKDRTLISSNSRITVSG